MLAPGGPVLVAALFVVGLLALVLGAESLVRGAAALSLRLGLAPLVVGLTVVAFGTSAPELAVSVEAGLSGQPGMALGNVVGSNACNVLLVLGLSAAFSPLLVDVRLVRIDVPLMVAASVGAFLLALDGTLSPWDGLVLLACGVAHCAWTVVAGRKAGRRDRPDDADLPRSGSLLTDVALIVLGLALLVVGARWLVTGAVAMARWLGLTELVIGLTVVAVGTSLPELATSVVAAARGHGDVAVGNVVGSNLFNVLIVLPSASIAGGGVPVGRGSLLVDLPVMIAVAVACLPVFFTGHRIDRWEGVVFVAFHAAYVAHAILRIRGPAWLSGYELAMAGLVVPLVLLTLGVLAWQERRRRRRATGPGG